MTGSVCVSWGFVTVLINIDKYMDCLNFQSCVFSSNTATLHRDGTGHS